MLHVWRSMQYPNLSKADPPSHGASIITWYILNSLGISSVAVAVVQYFHPQLLTFLVECIGFYGETTTAPKAFTTSREATNLCRSEAGTTWDKPILGWLDMTMGTISQKDLMGTEWECNGIYIYICNTNEYT